MMKTKPFVIRFLVNPSDKTWHDLTAGMKKLPPSHYDPVTDSAPGLFEEILRVPLVTAAPVFLSLRQHGFGFYDAWWQMHTTRLDRLRRRVTFVLKKGVNHSSAVLQPEFIRIFTAQTFGRLYIGCDKTDKEFSIGTTVLTFDGPTPKKASHDVILTRIGEFESIVIPPANRHRTEPPSRAHL